MRPDLTDKQKLTLERGTILRSLLAAKSQLRYVPANLVHITVDNHDSQAALMQDYNNNVKRIKAELECMEKTYRILVGFNPETCLERFRLEHADDWEKL